MTKKRRRLSWRPLSMIDTLPPTGSRTYDLVRSRGQGHMQEGTGLKAKVIEESDLRAEIEECFAA
jgi:hypothetical protein